MYTIGSKQKSISSVSLKPEPIVVSHALPGCHYKVMVDGTEFLFSIEKYDNVAGYAPCIITDTSTGVKYHTNGYLELNNHTFITRWKEHFNYDRSNWNASTELCIKVY